MDPAVVPRSRLLEKFGDEAAFLVALRSQLRPAAYSLIRREDHSELRLDGHHTLRHRNPRRRRLSLVARPNSHEYEPTVTLTLSWLVRTFAAKAVFDIGSGDGYFSGVAASVVDAPPLVHAFEMLPSRARKAKERAASYAFGDRIVPHLAGMSDTHRGDVTIWHSVTKMYETKPDPKVYRYPWWLKLKFLMKGRADRDELRQAVVMVTSVDHFCEANGIVPDIIKLDVDGYEAKVVPGAMKTLRRHRPFVLFELHKSRLLQPFGVDRSDVVRPLFEMGYRAVQLEDHNDLRKNAVSPVEPGSAAFLRQRTDFFLFY